MIDCTTFKGKRSSGDEVQMPPSENDSRETG